MEVGNSTLLCREIILHRLRPELRWNYLSLHVYRPFRIREHDLCCESGTNAILSGEGQAGYAFEDGTFPSRLISANHKLWKIDMFPDAA